MPEWTSGFQDKGTGGTDLEAVSPVPGIPSHTVGREQAAWKDTVRQERLFGKIGEGLECHAEEFDFSRPISECEPRRVLCRRATGSSQSLER